MSVDLSKLLSKRKMQIDELSGRIVAIDAYNAVYQFLSIIRQPDGMPLVGPSGEVTSHLSGLFYRTLELMEKRIQPIYVFDGLPSKLKQKTIAARIKRREEAKKAWEEAKIEGDVEMMRAKAMASTRITDEIVNSSRKLLELMGVGQMKAPGEGEAQASWMTKNGLSYATVSQDYDTLLFGAPRIARNVTFSGRRKLPGKNIYIKVEPEMVSLEDTLRELEVNQKQLIWIGILIGTDFNEGIDKVGPKTALKIARQSKSINDVKDYVKNKLDKQFELEIEEVEELFENPDVKELSKDEVSSLTSKSPDLDGIIGFMCDTHGFSRERIEKALAPMRGGQVERQQKGLDKWFG